MNSDANAKSLKNQVENIDAHLIENHVGRGAIGPIATTLAIVAARSIEAVTTPRGVVRAQDCLPPSERPSDLSGLRRAKN